MHRPKVRNLLNIYWHLILCVTNCTKNVNHRLLTTEYFQFGNVALKAALKTRAKILHHSIRATKYLWTTAAA